jgi:hypothetical protein
MLSDSESKRNGRLVCVGSHGISACYCIFGEPMMFFRKFIGMFIILSVVVMVVSLASFLTAYNVVLGLIAWMALAALLIAIIWE